MLLTEEGENEDELRGDTIGSRPIFWKLYQNHHQRSSLHCSGRVQSYITGRPFTFFTAYHETNLPAEINVFFADDHNVGPDR